MRHATLGLAIGLTLLAAAPAGAQVYRRLLPTSATSDSTWHTGVTDLSADGRFLVGYQDLVADSPHPSRWDMQLSSVRASTTGSPTVYQSVSDDGVVQFGYAPGTASPTSYRCSIATCQVITSMRSVFKCDGAGSIVWGNVVPSDGTHVAALSDVYGLRVAPTVGSGIVFALSEDGATAFYTSSVNGVTTAWRWTLADGSSPLQLGPSTTSETAIGASPDGTVAYYSDAISHRFRRYEVGVGFSDIVVPGGGYLTAITPDGSRGVGKLSLGNSPGFIWDPFHGITLLSDIVPGIESMANSPTISDDGMCVAGSVRTASGKANAFWLRLPDSFARPPADYSLDGNEDQEDVVHFIRYLAGEPNPNGLPLDFNRDGGIDTADVLDLVNCIAGGCP